MKMRAWRLILALVLSVTGLTAKLSGRSLEVSPAECRWQAESKAAKQEMPRVISVFNSSEKTKDYSVKVKEMKALKAEEEKGFKELPDASWVSFEPDTFSAGPGEKKTVKVFLEVPEEKLDPGATWLFYAEIREKPVKGDSIALACYPKIYVEMKEQRTKK